MKLAQLLRYFGTAIIVAICYFGAAWAGLAFAIPPGSATVIWPASGVAVSALVLLGYRLWPAVWIASCLVNMTTDVSFGLASSFATGNTVEPILAAWLIKRFLTMAPFAMAKDAFIFLAISATSCVPAATVGAFSMLLAGRIGSAEVGVNWSTWLLGDLVGQGGCCSTGSGVSREDVGGR